MKWNDRTVPSLCLLSTPEPAGKKTRLDAKFAVCTTVRGFILIRRTAGTVCSVPCQLQNVSEWQLHSCWFTNAPGLLPAVLSLPTECRFLSCRRIRDTTPKFFSLNEYFYLKFRPRSLIASKTKNQVLTRRISNYYETVVLLIGIVSRASISFSFPNFRGR